MSFSIPWRPACDTEREVPVRVHGYVELDVTRRVDVNIWPFCPPFRFGRSQSRPGSDGLVQTISI